MPLRASTFLRPRRPRAPHRVDFAYLEHVAGGDAAYVVLMSRLFCLHFGEQMFLAEAAAASADLPALRAALLRLGTTCQLLGLPRLVSLAHELATALLGPADVLLVQPGLRRLRQNGTAATRTLAQHLAERYPQALAALARTAEQG